MLFTIPAFHSVHPLWLGPVGQTVMRSTIGYTGPDTASRAAQSVLSLSVGQGRWRTLGYSNARMAGQRFFGLFPEPPSPAVTVTGAHHGRGASLPCPGCRPAPLRALPAAGGVGAGDVSVRGPVLGRAGRPSPIPPRPSPRLPPSGWGRPGRPSPGSHSSSIGAWSRRERRRTSPAGRGPEAAARAERQRGGAASARQR